jgi:hypothetical protein
MGLCRMSKSRWLWIVVVISVASLPLAAQKSSGKKCHIETSSFHGWSAQQLSNDWVKLIFVPQLGGRLMQVEFDGHPYLFVNPRFEGKYISPEQAAGRWINYGGDKIWPMPEGNQDEQHWVLESSALDDAPYAFKAVEQSAACTIELDGPIDEKTGLQYSRQVSIGSNSSAIHFHATMRNATAHTLQWSVQSVSQYNLASARDPSQPNRSFWAYTAVRDDSAYVNGFHVRSGLSDDPSFSSHDGIFRLHWMYLANEVWVDSQGGWLAVTDGETGYGMVERFHFDPSATYPGKATVIFYKNGPSVEFDDAAMPKLSTASQQETPYYMEAEINSPLVMLDPGAIYSFDTMWFPLRTSADVRKVTEAGVVTARLHAASNSQHIQLKGLFGVVIPGRLQARLFDKAGRDVKHIFLDTVSPRQQVVLDREIPVDFAISRISLHLYGDDGRDWGAIDEAEIRGNQ